MSADGTSQPPQLITRKEAAREIGKREHWVDQLIADGQLHAWKVGRHTMIYRYSLEAWKSGKTRVVDQQRGEESA